MKWALIARADNSGLGTLCRELARNLRPTKVLIVQNGVFQVFLERYEDFDTRVVQGNTTINEEDRKWVTDGVELIVSCETFYDAGIVHLAKKRGVKTALVTMCELFPERPDAVPDLYLCPSKLDMEMVPGPKAYLPFPVATDRLTWQKRTSARHFIHTASHGGVAMRKGTPLLIEAMKHVRSPIKLTIYTWHHFNVPDKRVEVRLTNFKNYWQVWKEGDVLVYPQDVNGICLPVTEAYVSGMGVLTTDIYPFNEWLPKELMFQPSGMRRRKFGSGLMEVEAAVIDPKAIAAKIDEVYGTDISALSERGREWGEANSWQSLSGRWLEVMEDLCARR